MRSLLTIAFAVLLLSSCEDEPKISNADLIAFMNLKPGNYWIYDWYEVTPTGAQKYLGLRDSVYIAKDTLINGNICYIKRGNFYGSARNQKWILFDSAGAVYSFPQRNVVFSLNESIAYREAVPESGPALAQISYSLQNRTFDIEVPAGEFNCVNFQGVIDFTDPTLPLRFNDNYYSESVGLVKMTTVFLGMPDDYEMRLVKTGRQF